MVHYLMLINMNLNYLVKKNPMDQFLTELLKKLIRNLTYRSSVRNSIGHTIQNLRVLTDQKFKRINGNSDINVDVRLICSQVKI